MPNLCARAIERKAIGVRGAFFPSSSFTSNADALSEIGVTVAHDFFSPSECDQLVDELLHSKAPGKENLPLRRWRNRSYQSDHWDGVINGYKELERSLELWTESNRALLERARAFIESHARSTGVYKPKEHLPWLPPHVVDLHPEGIIGAHVDSVKFSGGSVGGLSLLSTRKIVLEPHVKKDGDDALQSEMLVGAGPVPASPARSAHSFIASPGSIYILTKDARYHYAHAVVHVDGSGSDGERENGEESNRVSIVLRDAPPHSADGN